MKYGRVNLNLVDTTPGAGGAFSPPKGFTGEYRKFMVGQLAIDPGVRQHVACVARRLPALQPPEFVGPYAGSAMRLAWSVLRRLSSPIRGDSDE
ncbi:hypothetical protein LJR129_005026 [Acidovorax sp. LjRoot129]|uniref:hypothetical protein n=1 Tax=unclassified Acidovorax TaxID=2684926 RepID=UPI003ED1080E